RLDWDPVPHLIGLATASNIGSVATIIGNPQNMIIGLESQISFLRFSARLAPVAVLGLLVDFVLVAVVYRRTLSRGAKERPVDPLADLEQTPDTPSRRAHRWLLAKSLIVTLVAVALFFTPLPKDLIALGAAAFLLLARL